MKRNFDKFLLGLLWLLTIALATTFWMNIRYGFDIFSAAHWEYLSGLQADRSSIKPEFYISLIVAIGIASIGLYAIMRPRFRKISMPSATPETPAPAPAPATPQQNNMYGTLGGSKRPQSPASLQNMTVRKQPPTQQFAPPTQPMNTAMPTMPTTQPQKPAANPLFNDINTIFESAEYIMKQCKHIGKLQNPVVALGYNQTLWLATSNANPEDVVDAFQTLVALFDDTLGDSANDITLRGCIIAPTAPTEHDMISTFDSVDKFKQFISEHKNTQPDGFDKELFDAISTYVSTVASYIGKE